MWLEVSHVTEMTVGSSPMSATQTKPAGEERCCCGQKRRKRRLSSQEINPLPNKNAHTWYSIPKAAVTNSQRRGGVKQQRFILLLFCRPEVWNWGTCRGSAPSKGSREGSYHAPPSFQWLLAFPALCQRLSSLSLPPPSHDFCESLCVLPSSSKGPSHWF